MNQPINPVQQVDFAFYVIFGISIVLLFGITLIALFMVYRYHHERHPKPEKLKDNVWLEVVWILLPSLLVMAMFYYGWVGFKALRSVPEGAMQVDVVGRMFDWSFEYPDGKRSNVLYVPVDTPVRLNITSDDVIHSLYIPAFRIKMDAVPGMDTYAWFQPTELGTFDILCSEYCGIQHANMLSTVEVVSRADFEEWLNSSTKAQQDAVALFENYGCTSCHSLDGSRGTGPTLLNLYGKKHVVVTPDGTEKTIVVDKQYLREAIYDPNKLITKGYPAVMPSYEGQVPEEELAIMIGWMTGEIEEKPDGKALMENNGCLSCHSTDGSIIAAPSFKGLWGKDIALKQGETKVSKKFDAKVFENILRHPEIVKEGDWNVMMPVYDSFTPDEIDAMADYLKSLAVDEEQQNNDKQ